ncbi:MAG TPA: iron-containing alcohol dehydrogenase [Firmicutes bacterium]|nr:iron-containing alcohol dehydrogenase [Bacillota bacterium]
MENFVFHNPAKILFGKGVEKQAAQEVRAFGGTRVLLVYGGGSIKRSGLYDTLAESLRAEGLPFWELGGVQPNPRLGLVKEGIRLCREQGIDFLLAAGGGSVIDTAKGIAVGVPDKGDLWEFYERKRMPEKALPVGVVLTIPAAGSESSDSSVLTKEEGQRKLGFSSPLMTPRFAIMNPAFTCTLPAYQTACGASDILAHLMERYFTRVEHVDFTDRLIEASLRAILDYAPLALAHPEDYDIRAEIMWAGTIAHNNLLNTGRIGDWGSHRIEHELSALYDIAHGAGLAIVFPAWMKYVWREDPARFVQFASRVFGVEIAYGNPERAVETAIARLEQFYRSLGLPTRLSEAGIPDDRLREMAHKCTLPGPQGNFKKLYEEDVYNIYCLAK